MVASGLNNPRGLEFGPDGSLYVMEIANTGPPAAFIAGGQAGALARAAPDGAPHVTNNSSFGGAGRVLRVEP